MVGERETIRERYIVMVGVSDKVGEGDNVIVFYVSRLERWVWQAKETLHASK